MKKSLSLKLSYVLQKLRRRMPARLQSARGWLLARDWLVARHHLAGARRRLLAERWAGCGTEEEWFDFAREVFPSHQIRTEILGFLRYAQPFAPHTVVEIGTAEGGTNFLLGAALPTVRTKIAVDLFVQNTRLLRSFVRPDCRQVFVQGSSYALATVERVRRELAGTPIDVLFIDGDHSYDGAKGDFEAYAPLVRPGGLIAFHDIAPDFKTRFGRATRHNTGEVPRLWQDLRTRFSETHEFIADREQDGFGIGVIRLPDAPA